jgi:hypothetical protein
MFLKVIQHPLAKGPEGIHELWQNAGGNFLTNFSKVLETLLQNI